MRITHPFHPRTGEEFELLTVRHNWGEQRVYYVDGEGEVTSLPAQWTSVVGPDPVVMIAQGEVRFRVEDLLALARLLEALTDEGERQASDE